MNLFIASTSKENIPEELFENAKDLIEQISTIPNINLVFGAYHKGLMDVSYENFLKNNKKIIGVTTEYDKEACQEKNYSKKIVVRTSSERFLKIYSESDVLLFLPGGIGTLAELFSSIEEGRISNRKKIIIYNCCYFFTPIIEELYNLYQKGFIDDAPSTYMYIESDKNKIIELLKEEI